MPVLEENHKYIEFEDEEFKNMLSADGISDSILSYHLLGDVSAKNEWIKPDKARSTFIHLKSYEHFINKDQLLLLGRTGSGKSAIIYSMKDDIEKKKITQYNDVIQIDERELCERLAELCNNIDIDRFDATNKITNAIVMTIYTKVMIHCFIKFTTERDKMKHTIKYLLSENFIQTKDQKLLELLENITSDDFSQKFEDACHNSIVGTVCSVTNILLKIYTMVKCDTDAPITENNNYNKAIEEISSFLSQKDYKVLVLLDSFEEYKINDKAFVVAIKSLILACFDIHTNSSNSYIFFKMALASEIYTRVLTHLPAKNQTNTVAIIWSFKDLMKCMALRMVTWYYDADANHKEKSYLFKFLSKYNVSDLQESNVQWHIIEELFLNFLPKICKTNSNYTYLTLAFISRHTMKKPREILQVFNALLDRIIHENNPSFFLDANGNSIIKDIVHSLQNDFINQTLSLYRIFVPNLENYIYNLLSGRKFIFSITDDNFENKLKEVNAMVQNDTYANEYLSYFDQLDILRVVFETGLLGKVSRVRTVDVKNISQFGTDKPIKIIDALFEYQYKGRFPKNKNIQYVIHPMCYEHYNCLVGMRSMVNTDSYDDTELLTSVITNK